MAKKKKKRTAPSVADIKHEVAEEILALQAIYADDFRLHEDGVGFAVTVVPHPGALETNYVSLELHVRWARAPAAVLGVTCACRRKWEEGSRCTHQVDGQRRGVGTDAEGSGGGCETQISCDYVAAVLQFSLPDAATP
jgi:hypothetical protein